MENIPDAAKLEASQVAAQEEAIEQDDQLSDEVHLSDASLLESITKTANSH
jgi:hypothetical protein